ncbi:uracil-DNA glycosylase [Natrinema saccharevitans]|uniref:Uracil-DNA glycosylase n=1 Tax=Natrinema saccharevitans TaxID=301967 RepID=A0A1S8AWN5_9EURY|nr:uracil-DNA glycosylase family protein [Natrinema saccharevitans]OLZ40959.1 uracil-DNA glycosylase [Natrinema saccharevitans]
MRNVTDRTSNPFGLRAPFDRSDPGDRPAVFGYGDANADFHVIGDYPGVHGGETTGVPFTETEAGLAVQDVVRAVGFASGPRDEPVLENCFWSYVHPCSLPAGETPTDDDYDDLERFFDAELRAINAHILLPVGARPTDRVLREYTTQRRRYDDPLEMAALHASEIRGRGFLVVPIRDPREWGDGDREAIVARLEALLESDYRQTKGVATTVG